MDNPEGAPVTDVSRLQGLEEQSNSGFLLTSWEMEALKASKTFCDGQRVQLYPNKDPH